MSGEKSDVGEVIAALKTQATFVKRYIGMLEAEVAQLGRDLARFASHAPTCARFGADSAEPYPDDACGCGMARALRRAGNSEVRMGSLLGDAAAQP